MGYVRFENTYHELFNCYDYLFDDVLSEREKKYRKYLIELCKKITDEAFDVYFDGEENGD